jgi:hypothetical protein
MYYYLFNGPDVFAKREKLSINVVFGEPDFQRYIFNF